jgi:hypothetical protein
MLEPTIHDWTRTGAVQRATVGEVHCVNQYRGPETFFNFQNERFCGLWRAGNGNLVVAFGMRPDIVLPKGVPLEHYQRASGGAKFSKDNGVTWSERALLDYGGNKGGTTPGGEVILPAFLTLYQDSQTLRMPTNRTRDGGETWEIDMDVRVRFPKGCTLVDAERWDYPPGYASMWYWGDIFIAEDGALLGSMYGQFDEADDPYCWTAVLIRSEDEGRSWDYVSTIAGGRRGPFFQATEPCIMPLGGGRMVAVFRNGEEPRVLGQCWSEDGGQSWGEAFAAPGIRTVGQEDRKHVNPEGATANYSGGNVSPILSRLENGVLAVVYGRPGIQAALSYDGAGEHWDEVVELVPRQPPYSLGHTEGTSGMAGMIAEEPNTFTVVYDVHNYTPEGRPHGANTVFLRRINID